MSCKKCKGPIGKRSNFLTAARFEYSKTAKAIKKIKVGIECPEFDKVCGMPALPNHTIGGLCKDNPELAFHTGFEMAALQCGEILAKAQNDDK